MTASGIGNAASRLNGFPAFLDHEVQQGQGGDAVHPPPWLFFF